MLRTFRERAQDEKGFTLIELLVVILIIGILAAIAIPSFLNQRSKGNDAEAKSTAVTAAQAAETCATDNNGVYTSCTETAIQSIEPTLNDADLDVVAAGVDTYEVAVTSEGSASNVFSIERLGDGTTDLTCTTAGTDGCPSGGNWGE